VGKRLIVFVLDALGECQTGDLDQPRQPLAPPRTARSIFLASEFQDPQRAQRWRAELEAQGYTVLHGPVPEREATLETSLGQRIREATMTLAVVEGADPDFGLPIWIEHELEYAAARERVAAIFGAAMPQLALGPPVLELPSFGADSAGTETTEITRLLLALFPRNS
jgi:hypothetical protein